PARRIETIATFLPAITGASIGSSGVSIRSVVIGSPRVSSYPMSSEISLSRWRNWIVGVRLSRMSDSLCWIRGWPSTLRLGNLLAGDIAFASAGRECRTGRPPGGKNERRGNTGRREPGHDEEAPSAERRIEAPGAQHRDPGSDAEGHR